MIAGPNGAGKTTLTQVEPLRNLISGVELLNPDVETLRRLNEQGIAGFATASSEALRRLFPESADFVLTELRRRLARGERVAVETVLSTDKYRLWRDVLDAQGRFRLIYVGLRTPELAARRVALRVALGGHDVPVQKSMSAGRDLCCSSPGFWSTRSRPGSSTIPDPMRILHRCSLPRSCGARCSCMSPMRFLK